MTNDTRAAFEAWVRKDCGDLSTFGSGKNIHYSNSAVNNAWDGWQAGYAASRRAALEEAAKACEDVADGHDFTHNTQAENAADQCAAAIRALGDYKGDRHGNV